VTGREPRWDELLDFDWEVERLLLDADWAREERQIDEDGERTPEGGEHGEGRP